YPSPHLFLPVAVAPPALHSFPTRRSSDLLRRASAPGLTGERRAVLEGVVLGDDAGLGEGLKTSFRRSGLYHLLAVSGQNVILLRSEEHTSELQSRGQLVCRLLLEKKKSES